MIDVIVGQSVNLGAPHSGANTTQYKYVQGGTALVAKTPTDLVGGMIVFPRSFTVAGQYSIRIDAVGPGGTESVTETVNVTPQPPAPPAPFSGPIVVVP